MTNSLVAYLPRNPSLDAWPLVLALAVFAAAMFLLQRWLTRRRDRSRGPNVDPDRGGDGITLVNAPFERAAPAGRRSDAEREEAWLRGFAAPFEGAPREPASAASWQRARHDAERELLGAGDPAAIAWAVASLADVLHGGVLDGHLDDTAALARIREAVRRLDPSIHDWFAFGDLLAEAARAHPDRPIEIRSLYLADGSWSDPAWPPR